MVKEIVHDPLFLARKSAPALPEDAVTADDLKDTLRANAGRCVGMAANMIGVARRIIVFSEGSEITEMMNPELLTVREPYEAEEGCLSLAGTRKAKRFRQIKVKWQTRGGETRIRTFTGFTAQIIQHEIDHLNGILI